MKTEDNVKQISVLLADDHNVVRQGLKALLEQEPDIVVYAEARTGREAVFLAGRLRPNVVIMDIVMPLLNGAEATRQILKAQPSTKVLALSCYSDDDCIEQMIQAGAVGFLLKQAAASELIRTIREVYRGKSYFSPAVAGRMSAIYQQASRGDLPVREHKRLTVRESEVLQLIAEGFSNKQVSMELGISTKTVEKHRQQVMNKLNLHHTAGLTRFAFSKHWVENDRPPGL